MLSGPSGKLLLSAKRLGSQKAKSTNGRGTRKRNLPGTISRIAIDRNFKTSFEMSSEATAVNAKSEAKSLESKLFPFVSLWDWILTRSLTKLSPRKH